MPTPYLTTPTQAGPSNSKASSPTITAHSSPQDDLLEVVDTPDRGFGVFTRRKIKAGTLILAERPLLSLSKTEESDPTAIERVFSSLLTRAEQKTYLHLFDAEKSRMSRVTSIYYSNCYNCEGLKADGTGGSAIGAMASRINHSCVPNVLFSYHEATDEMRFYAIRDIPRGKEVSSNYDKSVFEVAAQRRRKQQMYYGFMCTCEACEPKTDFWAKSDERRRDMYDAVRVVQGCEKKFSNMGADVGIANEALDALVKLESLMIKEGLLGIPLANTYRSLAKWVERKGHGYGSEIIKWKTKELEVCITGFGKDAQRTRDIETRLQELGEGRL